ncbi:MAG: alpha/beta fold hydrolase [Planctomycetota bacterium]
MKLVVILVVLGIGFFLASVVAVGLVLPAGGRRAQPDRDRFVTVLGARLAYRTEGSGEATLILLHGFGGSLEEWGPVVPRLPGRVIRLDLVGFGASDRPPISYDLETQRRHLIAFMDALEIPRATLIGRSMGASLAAWTAAHSPDRIDAVVLSAPSGYPGSLTYGWPHGALYRPGIANRAVGLVARTPVFRWLFPRSLAQQAATVSASYDATFAEALGKIRQPTLLFWSRGDGVVPFAYSAEYQARIPHAELIEFPAAAAHHAPTFDPQKAATHIHDLLRRRG